MGTVNVVHFFLMHTSYHTEEARHMKNCSDSLASAVFIHSNLQEKILDGENRMGRESEREKNCVRAERKKKPAKKTNAKTDESSTRKKCSRCFEHEESVGYKYIVRRAFFSHVPGSGCNMIRGISLCRKHTNKINSVLHFLRLLRTWCVNHPFRHPVSWQPLIASQPHPVKISTVRMNYSPLTISSIVFVVRPERNEETNEKIVFQIICSDWLVLMILKMINITSNYCNCTQSRMDYGNISQPTNQPLRMSQ